MSFAIVTDSLAGLPLAQIARRGLVVIPLSYTISGKEHLCLAPEGYDSAAFFQTMKLRGEVSTSMVPPHRFLTFLKPLLRSGLDLLFLSASSGLSSSYQSACMAAEQLRETSVSSARNSVSTSENPNLPKILPPTVARFRNCTPTILRTLSRAAPSV